MKPEVAKTAKRGDKIVVRGEVRKVHPTGKWIEVQFPSYSLEIPVEDIDWARTKWQRRAA